MVPRIRPLATRFKAEDVPLIVTVVVLIIVGIHIQMV